MGEITKKSLVQWSREYYEKEFGKYDPQYMKTIYKDNQAYDLYEKVVKRINLVLGTNLPLNCRTFIRYFTSEDLGESNTPDDMILAINAFTEEEISFFEFLLKVIPPDKTEIKKQRVVKKQETIDGKSEQENIVVENVRRDMFRLLKNDCWEELCQEVREELYDRIESLLEKSGEESILVEALYQCQDDFGDLAKVAYKLRCPMEYRILNRMSEIANFISSMDKECSKEDKEMLLSYLDKKTKPIFNKMITVRDKEEIIINRLYRTYFGRESVKFDGEKYMKLSDLWDAALDMQKKGEKVIKDIQEIEKLKRIKQQKVKKKGQVKENLRIRKEQLSKKTKVKRTEEVTKDKIIEKRKARVRKFAGVIRRDPEMRRLMKERAESESLVDQQIQMQIEMSLQGCEQ